MNKAEVVKDRLEHIRYENGGKLSPAAVVDDARPDDSLLHGYFCWDDSEAAEQFRRVQAGHLIRRVTMTYAVDEDKGIVTRAYVSLQEDRGDDEGSYYATVDLLADDDKRQQMLESAMKDFKSWRQKYETLQELAEIFAVADQLELVGVA